MNTNIQSSAREQHARDLPNMIASWNLKFSGHDRENVGEFSMRIAEYRQRAVLRGSGSPRAISMMLECQPWIYVELRLREWEIGRNAREIGDRCKHRDDLYTESLVDEARACIQKSDEPVRAHINAMQLIYSKLPQKPAGETMMDMIYRNMRYEFHPFMRDHLHSDIKTFTQPAVEMGKAFDASKAYARPGARLN